MSPTTPRSAASKAPARCPSRQGLDQRRFARVGQAHRELPEEPYGLPLAERFAMGKARRDTSARADHATWKPAANRPDPVDVILGSEKGRLESLLPIRHSRMLATPFTFYRGAAILQAADLGGGPSTDLMVWACGDAHLLNFGGFATPERKMVFDINDFDEAAVAPFEWDVKRLAASFVLAGRDRGFDATASRQAAWTAVQRYRQQMLDYSAGAKSSTPGMPPSTSLDLISQGTDKEMQRLNLRWSTPREQRTREGHRLREARGHHRRSAPDQGRPPLIFHLAEWEDEGSGRSPSGRRRLPRLAATGAPPLVIPLRIQGRGAQGRRRRQRRHVAAASC